LRVELTLLVIGAAALSTVLYSASGPWSQEEDEVTCACRKYCLYYAVSVVLEKYMHTVALFQGLPTNFTSLAVQKFA